MNSLDCNQDGVPDDAEILPILRLDVQHAQLGGQAQPTLLRHQQQLGIGIVEKPSLHGTIGRIDVDTDTSLLGRATVAGQRHQAVDEIRRCAGEG